MRFQLLKTTPYLGGQIRWDIPLYYHYEDGEHIMDTPELHIVPLNDDIKFNEDNSWETFNYSHIENVKHLYEQIGDDMFTAYGEWTGEYWLYNNGDILDPYSHVYNMGARRTRFTRYNKQFSFLCPLWISEETNPELFEFEVSIKVSGEERDHIIRRVFRLSDKICGYMADYLNKSARYMEPDPAAPNPGYQGVTDDLLSIKFNPNYAYITGVDVQSGNYTTMDVTYMIGDILSREIPMIEFDNILISKFMESHVVAQQLINLNFLFNMEDISYVLKESLLGKHITVVVRTKYDGQYLPIKDFYTNYTNIPSYRMDRSSMSNVKNVCDYLGDNIIVDYMYTNKFTQPLFHWAMVENPTYIYNFYDGFAPIFKDGNAFYRIAGRYYDQADLSQINHDVYNSAANWCKTLNNSGLTATISMEYNNKVLQEPDLYASQLFMNFDTGISYLNNNRFDMAKMDIDSYHITDLPPVYIYAIIKDPGNINESDNVVNPTLNASMIITNMNDKIIIRFECDNINYSTYYRYSNLIKQAIVSGYGCTNGERTFVIHMADGGSPESMKDLLRFIADMYDNWISPYRIEFTKGTLIDTVPSFGEHHPKECYMYKYNAYNSFVLRYTGALCPMFISPTDENYRNINYRYKQWGDINNSDVRKYGEFIKTGMKPLYPSIDYYSLEEEYDSTSRPQWYTDNWPWEVIWKNDGIIYILPERYETSFVEHNPIPYDSENEEQKMWQKLYDYIDSIGIQVETTWMKHKLKELYNISYNFDYPDETNVNEILYHVKFDLR